MPGAQTAVRKQDHIPNFIDGWYVSGPDGLIRVDIERAKGHWGTAIPEGTYRVMIRHPRYAPTTLHVDVPSTQSEIVAKLDPGEVIKFQVKPYADSELPSNLLPVIVDGRVSTTTLRSFHPASDYNYLGEPLRLFTVEKVGADLFQARVPDDLDFPLMVIINHPNYMHNYVSREYSPTEILQGETVVELPVPGQLKVEVKPEKTTATEVFEIREIIAGIWNEDSLPIITTASSTINTEIKGVVPGQYSASINGRITGDVDKEKRFPSYAKPALYVYPDPVTVSTGSQALLKHTYPPLATKYFDGDGSVTLTFKHASGSTTKGLPFRVLGHTEHYQFIPIREGVIADDGTVTISNLRRNDIRYYDIQVGTVSSSIITFSDDSHVSATRFIAPAKGEVAPELEAWDLETSQPLSVADLKGKIILMEFWATWCGPCQPSMQKLSGFAKSLPADLQDEVALVTISVDDGPDEVKKRLDEKGWIDSRVRHYWYGPGTPSARGGPYGVTSIPHAVIIGIDGRIAVPNYNLSDDLEDTLRELLK